MTLVSPRFRSALRPHLRPETLIVQYVTWKLGFEDDHIGARNILGLVYGPR